MLINSYKLQPFFFLFWTALFLENNRSFEAFYEVYIKHSPAAVIVITWKKKWPVSPDHISLRTQTYFRSWLLGYSFVGIVCCLCRRPRGDGSRWLQSSWFKQTNKKTDSGSYRCVLFRSFSNLFRRYKTALYLPISFPGVPTTLGRELKQRRRWRQ